MKQDKLRTQGEMLGETFTVIRELLAAGQTRVEVEIHVYDPTDTRPCELSTSTSIEIKSSRFIGN